MDTETKESKSTKRKILWLVVGVVLIVIVLAGLSAAYWHSKDNKPPSAVLAEAAKQLDFNIYYPVQKLLPAGYTFNLNSISYSSEVLIYNVSYNGSSKLSFSEQQKPSSGDISDFYTAHMPLYVTKSTFIGSAAVGAIGSQTIVSLPTNTNTWIIITAPAGANQNQLVQALNSLKVVK